MQINEKFIAPVAYTKQPSFNEQKLITADAWANWLQAQTWQRFCTFTTGYPLSLPSARRAMERFYARAQAEVFNGADVQMFWVAEKFECKDGYHTHGLLNYDNTSVSGVPNLHEVLSHTWNVVSGAYGKRKRYRSSFSNYNKKRSAGKYCSKYLLKRYADYDFLF